MRTEASRSDLKMMHESARAAVSMTCAGRYSNRAVHEKLRPSG